jgi:hypothetical protein
VSAPDLNALVGRHSDREGDVKRTNVVALAVLVLGTTVAIAAGTSLAGPGVDRGDSVYGGGRHALPGECTDGTTPFCPPPREFSLDAHATGSGRNAEGTLEYANADTGALIASGDVTCLNVDGERAVVGGRLNEGPATGAGFLIHLEDRGRPGSATRDRVSPLLLLLTPEEEPAGFPRTCPAFEEDVNGVGFFAQTYGDVAVNDR